MKDNVLMKIHGQWLTVHKALTVIKQLMSLFNTIILLLCVADVVACTSCEENTPCLNQFDIFFWDIQRKEKKKHKQQSFLKKDSLERVFNTDPVCI